MGIGSFFRFFQPKDKVFYTLFEKVTENLTSMSQDLVNEMKNQKIKDETFLKKMEDYEHENDQLTHEIFIELGQNFITPFDREDIHHLATSLDDIADFMYASTKYIYLYKTPYNKAFEDISELINLSCIELKKAIFNLRDYKDTKAVRQACVTINSNENIADDIFSNAIAKMFEDRGDVIDIIKIKNVLEYLETVTDKCEDAANIIESILIKYA